MKTALRIESLIGCISGLLVSLNVVAAGQVSSVLISEKPATPFSYTVDGFDYNWGRGSNQFLEGFVVDGLSYGYSLSADKVVVRQVRDLASSLPCDIFVEGLRLSERSRTYSADFPHDGSEAGNCRLESVLESRIINRGVVDTFSNTAADAKNIERLDYLFFYGASTPLSAELMSQAGHVVAEKLGNNPVKMAAILSLDVFGQPAEYGPLVLVGSAGCSSTDICFGTTDLVHTYSFLHNATNAPDSLPEETGRSREAMSMAFVSAASLGLAPGQRYYGVSLFADDVDADIHNLVDPDTFPDDTSDDYILEGDDADIYGGLTGYFLADALSVVRGRLFVDINGDGFRDPNEAGISDISLSLYRDIDGNGMYSPSVDTQIGDSLVSNLNGEFVFPGLSDGNYLVVLDESDPEIPAGFAVAQGTNPHPFTIAGIDADRVQFSFVSDAGDPDGDGSDGDGSDGDGSDGDGSDGDGSDGDGSDGDGSDGDGSDGDGSDGDGSDGDGSDGDGSDGDGSDGDGSDGDGSDGDGSDGDGSDGDGSDGDGSDGDGSDGDGSDGDGSDGDGDNPIDDVATTAVSDQFSVDQGKTTTLDVLANDIGAGLTIISVSESANATITVSDDESEIVYLPDYGYYSDENEPDTFTYTIRDTDGDTHLASVSVNVIRYSDINENEQNDFEECNCTELLLETGVNGSGLGHPSRFLIGALTMLAAWRTTARLSLRKTGGKGGQ